MIIETWSHTLGMAETLAVEARRLGIHPFLIHMTDRAFYEGRSTTRPWNATTAGRVELAALRSADAYIQIPESPEGFLRRAALPETLQRANSRREADWYRALTRGKIPSVLLLSATATRSSARHYGVDYARWKEESLRASSIPASVLQRRARPVVDRLAKGRQITLRHPNGTRLELGLKGRSPVVESGRVDPKDLAQGHIGTTFPGGVVFVALDEGVAEGVFLANRPSRHRQGEILGLRWSFRNGRLATHGAESGRKIFEGPFGKAGRERDRPALLAIGLNPEIRDFPLAEDQEAGVVTLYIGHNDDFGGRSRGKYREYALLRGADLLVDDKPILRAGRIAR